MYNGPFVALILVLCYKPEAWTGVYTSNYSASIQKLHLYFDSYKRFIVASFKVSVNVCQTVENTIITQILKGFCDKDWC